MVTGTFVNVIMHGWMTWSHLALALVVVSQAKRIKWSHEEQACLQSITAVLLRQ